MKIDITNTSIDIYGLPSLQEMANLLAYLQCHHPGQYDRHHIKTGLIDPIERGLLQLMADADRGILDLSKDYFPGCDPALVTKEIEKLAPQQGERQ